VTEFFRSKVVRSLWAIPLALGYLFVRSRLATAAPFGAPEWLYLATQALRLGSLVACSLGVLAWLDARSPGRRALLVLSALLGAASPRAIDAARYAGQADAVMRLGLPTAWVFGGTLALLLGGLTFAWGYQRASNPSPRWHAAALLVLVCLVIIDLVGGFSQSGLAPFCYGLAVALSAVFLQSLLAMRMGLSQRLALVASLPIALAGVTSWLSPALAERGRASLHRAQSSLPHLDMHLGERASEPSLVDRLTRIAAPRCPAAARSPTALALPAERRKNVILISIDTVRADDALASHRGKPVMPELAKFMQESWTAPQAYSAYPATLISLSSSFTGQLPSRLMMQSPAPRSILGPSLGSHARLAVLPQGTYFNRAPVEHYITQGATRITGNNGNQQTRAAIDKLRALRAAGQPHVMWVHYLEPHEPYRDHPEFGFAKDERGRYRSELAYVDRQLGRLLGALREGGWYEDSLIVVFSDHGEAFGEHGQQYHHYQLYPWLIQVPFAMHVPGAEPRRFAGPVQLTDLAPTVFEFLGAAVQREGLDGHALITDPPAADRVILSEEFPAQLASLSRYAQSRTSDLEEAQRRALELEEPSGYPSKISVIQGTSQMILHRGTGVLELYDLARDPGAERNLAQDDEQRAGTLRRALDAWFGEVASSVRCEDSATRLSLGSLPPR
jgi:arylsulfatase A-like enzyme